jgi:hypothetical protein
VPVKLAYWAVSFVMGEAVPDALLLAGLLVIPAAGLLVWSGARHTPQAAWTGGVLAAIGFVGVANWVSYPFVPARMLFVLPFFVVLLARGAEFHRRAGRVAIAAMLVVSVCGIGAYFRKAGFRNKQYPIPMREIAAEIRRTPGAVILVDSTNSDPIALEYELHSQNFLQTGHEDTRAALERALADPRVRTVWFLRNTHDVSREQWNARFDALLRSRMRATVRGYEAYSSLELYLMHRADAPRYFHELIEYRR